MKNSSRIPTVIGVLLLVLGIGAGVFLVNREQIFKLGASPEVSPKDVRITNVSDDSFTVSWVTDKETNAFIKWGETSNLGQTLADSSATAVAAHSINFAGLSAGRTYYFKINSNGSDYDNNGVPWSASTAVSKSQGTNVRVSGSVLSSTGSPQGNVLIYIDTKEAGSLSTITSINGNWTLNVPSNNADPRTVLLNLYAQGGSNGIATAQTYLANANPIPPVTLGQTFDFRSSTDTNSGNTDTNAVISLPTDSTSSAESRFDTSTKTTTTTSTVTIKSVDDGETIFTDKPQFFGEGPKNTTITITVHSDQVVNGTAKTTSTGDWSWTPPSNLAPGEHTVTLSWTDASGILRTLTRTFIVEVNAQEPSFVSTPSGATSTPTPTASSTPKPSLTPTATPIATIKPTPTTSTSSSLPNAGDSEMSIALMVFGGILLLSGVFIAKKSI